MKRYVPAAVLLLAAAVLFSACEKSGSTGNTVPAAPAAEISIESAAKSSSTPAVSSTVSAEALALTGRDSDSSYDESDAVTVDFSDSGADANGKGVTIEGTSVTITKKGTYILSGSCSDGSVTVDTDDDDKVQLVLADLSLACESGPALYIRSADKVFVTIPDGTASTLSDGTDCNVTGVETSVDAAVFSRSDLTLNGTGTLTVTGNLKHGIVSRDDLVIADCMLNVSAVSAGLEGKDCVKLSGCTLDITAGTDGIRSTNDEDDGRGFVYIESGSITVDAGTDGIQAETLLQINSGTLSITAGGGSANASTGSGWGSWGMPDRENTEDTGSAKGLRSGTELMISGGIITIDSSDDAVHTDGVCCISGGTVSILSGDDGIHADTSLLISGGSITVAKSYEGMEAAELTVAGGYVSVSSSDDGLNAAGGTDSSSLSERPGRGHFSSDTGTMTISGGYIVLVSGGDGFDSNGTIAVSGGVSLISGPSDNDNAAFDYETGASVTGGILIALGSSGMAENFTESNGQGAILAAFTAQNGGSFAVCDSSGAVLASFSVDKSYSCALVTAPGIAAGCSYTLIAGGTVSDTDINGFTYSGTVSGGTSLAICTLTSGLCSFGNTGIGAGGFGEPGGGRPH